MLKNSIVNVNARVCPTTFVLIPFPHEENPSEKKSMMQHLSKLYRAVSSPSDTLKNILQSKYYIALVCEVCRNPPDDRELWYVVEKPKEIVGKILPLARAGLKFAYVLNKLSAVGRIFGLPTPIIKDSTFSDSVEFLNDLEGGSLGDYSELEKLAEENYKDIDTNSPSNPLTSGEGYCIREFSMFLSKVDPEKRWANLSPRLNEEGNLCYVCPLCLGGSK